MSTRDHRWVAASKSKRAPTGPKVAASESKRARTGPKVVGSTFERVRKIVKQIPRGQVMTYGDVAAAAGMPGAARTVGYALRALGRDVPWQRVLGRKSRRTAHVTIRDLRGRAEQRGLLEREGVRFDATGAVPLETFGFRPKR